MLLECILWYAFTVLHCFLVFNFKLIRKTQSNNCLSYKRQESITVWHPDQEFSKATPSVQKGWKSSMHFDSSLAANMTVALKVPFERHNDCRAQPKWTGCGFAWLMVIWSVGHSGSLQMVSGRTHALHAEGPGFNLCHLQLKGSQVASVRKGLCLLDTLESSFRSRIENGGRKSSHSRFMAAL